MKIINIEKKTFFESMNSLLFSLLVFIFRFSFCDFQVQVNVQVIYKNYFDIYFFQQQQQQHNNNNNEKLFRIHFLFLFTNNK